MLTEKRIELAKSLSGSNCDSDTIKIQYKQLSEKKKMEIWCTYRDKVYSVKDPFGYGFEGLRIILSIIAEKYGLDICVVTIIFTERRRIRNLNQNFPNNS